jgi:hypothetical protein
VTHLQLLWSEPKPMEYRGKQANAHNSSILQTTAKSSGKIVVIVHISMWSGRLACGQGCPRNDVYSHQEK